MTGSNVLGYVYYEKTFDLCFTVRKDFFHSILTKSIIKWSENRKIAQRQSLIFHMCPVSGWNPQWLDESALNHSAIGGAYENDQGFIYKQAYIVR